MQKVGRKSKYNPETTPELAEKYASEGYADIQIAEMLGIKKTVFYEWQNKYPEFAEALKRGKIPANTELKRAMLKTAMGYTVEEEETTAILDKNKQVKSYRTTKRRRYISPNPTMQIFLAKNRMPEEFRDVNKHEIDLHGQLGVTTLAELIMEDENTNEAN